MDLIVGASSNAVKSLVGKLGSLLAQEYTLIEGVHDDIQYINDELASMQAFINRNKRASGNDEQRQDWMKQVREVSNDIEDCINGVNHRLGHEPRGNGKLFYLRKKWYLLTTLYARRSIATQIRNLKIRAQHVSDRRTRYGVESLTGGGGQAEEDEAPTDRVTPPELIGTKQPVGVEDAMNELGEWFQFQEGGQNQRNKFLGIHGFGGLGKTTLALELYRKFGSGFECRAFVQVSQKFDLVMLLRSLVVQFSEQSQNDSSSDKVEELGEINKLKEMLHGQLKDKRYLILIDDIWSVLGWEMINDSLPDIGGRIVVTTRFKSVAVACCRENGHAYEHIRLDDKKSYNLFRQIIPSAPHHPTDVASDLLKKCGGLPLVIIVVAGLVASKLRSGPSSSTLDDYLPQVATALSGELGTDLDTQGVTKILDNCYADLPFDLKTCLLYMSMFPKGCPVSRKRLIRRWIAEGFITENHGKTMEEVAEDCFNELIVRNLIRAVDNSSKGKVKNYQIHDMVLEYIVSKSSHENVITVVGGHWQTPFPSYKVRRLSVQTSYGKETVERMKLSHVRSLTAFESFKALHSCLLKFQILQVLDLESCKDLSPHQLDKICKMHQLKYLSLRHTDTEEIPSKIDMLECLEVLDIRETKVRQLPPSVVRLKRMTHLLTGDKSKRMAVTLTEEITKMTALETLSGVEICGSSAAATTSVLKSASMKSSCSHDIVRSLGCLVHLEVLCIRWSFHECSDAGVQQAFCSAIKRWKHLKSLTIHCGLGCWMEFPAASLPNPIPCDRIKKFKVTGGRFVSLPPWFHGLQHLASIEITVCRLDQEDLRILANLRSLKCLVLGLHFVPEQEIVIGGGEGFIMLGRLSVCCRVPWLTFSEGAMPSLTYLELKFGGCTGTEDRIPSGLGNLGSLQELLLHYNELYTNDSNVKTIVDAVRKGVAQHHNLINLIINGVQYEDGYVQEEASHGGGVAVIKPCSVKPLPERIGELWRGLRGNLSCMGINPLKYTPIPFKSLATEQALNCIPNQNDNLQKTGEDAVRATGGQSEIEVVDPPQAL